METAITVDQLIESMVKREGLQAVAFHVMVWRSKTDKHLPDNAIKKLLNICEDIVEVQMHEDIAKLSGAQIYDTVICIKYDDEVQMAAVLEKYLQPVWGKLFTSDFTFHMTYQLATYSNIERSYFDTASKCLHLYADILYSFR